MSQRKLQIFLSSTYGDLVPQRLAAMEAILKSGHIPAAMEQFSPGDETAWDTIKTWIDESDAFILILGGRYGSIEPSSGKSYVELEYDYAIEKKKPFFALVVSDKHHEERVKSQGLDVHERDHPEDYKRFRRRVEERLCGFWNDEKDIKLSILQKLPEWSRNPELIGWVRGSEAVDARTANELALLSEENRKLREAGLKQVETFEGLSFEEITALLRRFAIEPAQFQEVFDTDAAASNPLELMVKAGGWLLNGVRVHPSREFGGLVALIELGLVERRGDELHLTESGRRFRNRLIYVNHTQGDAAGNLHSDPNLR